MDTATAPGCFGAASVFALDCDTCQACPAHEQCREQAHQTLEGIKGRINVQDIIKRHQKARLASEAQRKAATITPQPASPAPQPAPVTEPMVRKTSIEQVKHDVSAQDQATIDRVTNSKVKAVATSLARDNKLGYIRRELGEGRNPFAGRQYPQMRVATDMLLHGGFTKPTLKERYVREFGWADGTAASQRAEAVCMLQALQVVREVGGHFTLDLQ